MSEIFPESPLTSLPKAVAEHGAFPMPVGPQPQELSPERLAEIRVRERAASKGPWWTDRLAESDGSESIGVDAGDDHWIVPCQDLDPADAEFIAHARADVPALLDEVDGLRAQRERRRTRLVALQNDALNIRGALSPMGEDRKVPFPLGPTLLPAVEWLIGRVAELEADLATANGALDDVAEVRRAEVCPRPPEIPPAPHQVGCLFDGVPVSPPSGRPVDGLTRAFAPVAALREPDGEHYATVHRTYRVSHDLPETGGAS